MITGVKLRNWKSHEETELKLGDGTNVLVGIMGSGKSAVLDAITYALFGTVPAVQNRTIKLEDLIRNRPRQAKSTEVEVRFIAPDENEYVVKRIIERGRGTVLSEFRRANGELIESPSSTRVSEAIQSLLKLDYDLFERAIYAEQNRLDYFLTIRRGERMRKMDELLGINKLELARKNMITLINRVISRSKDREKMISQLQEDASLASLPILEQELEDSKSSRRKIERGLEELQPKLEANEKQLKDLQEVQEKLTKLDKSFRQLEGIIITLNQQMEQIKEKLGESVKVDLEELGRQVSGLQQNFERKKKNVDTLTSKLTSYSSQTTGLATEIKLIQESLAKLSSEIERKREARGELEKLQPPQLRDRVEQLQKDKQEIEGQLAANMARTQDILQALKELEAAGSTCPTCERPLSEEKKQQLIGQRRKRLEERQTLILELKSQLSTLAGELDRASELQKRGESLEKEAEGLKSLEDEYSELSRKLQVKRSELERVKEAEEKIRVEVEVERKETENLREKLNAAQKKLEMRIELDRIEKESKQKQADRLRVQRELWQLQRTYDEEKAKELRNRHEDLIRTQERLKTELSSISQLIAEKEKLLESVREKKRTLERYQIEVKNLDRVVESLQKIQVALARSQISMRRHFIEAVNSTMNELWRDIYPYGDYTGIRLAVEGGERTGDYVLQLSDRAGNWVPVEGITSGGEQTCACLALRIAFATVLAPALSWLVLDEPTHNLDAEGIQELAIVLRERIPEIVHQLLLITHEERLEAAVSGYLYRFYRDKNKDEPTRVKQITAIEE